MREPAAVVMLEKSGETVVVEVGSEADAYWRERGYAPQRESDSGDEESGPARRRPSK